MMLGEVVAENPGAIGDLEQLQAFFVELLERHVAALEVIEDSECNFHRAVPRSVAIHVPLVQLDIVELRRVVAHDFPRYRSGTPSKSCLITLSELGQVESVCGKSDAHM